MDRDEFENALSEAKQEVKQRAKRNKKIRENLDILYRDVRNVRSNFEDVVYRRLGPSAGDFVFSSNDDEEFPERDAVLYPYDEANLDALEYECAVHGDSANPFKYNLSYLTDIKLIVPLINSIDCFDDHYYCLSKEFYLTSRKDGTVNSVRVYIGAIQYFCQSGGNSLLADDIDSAIDFIADELQASIIEAVTAGDVLDTVAKARQRAEAAERRALIAHEAQRRKRDATQLRNDILGFVIVTGSLIGSVLVLGALMN